MLSIYVKWQVALKSLLAQEEGQDLVEYALIIALVSLALVAGLTALAGGIDNAFDAVVAKLPAAAS